MKHFQPMFPVKCLRVHLVCVVRTLLAEWHHLRLPQPLSACLRATRGHGGRGASVFSFFTRHPIPIPISAPPAALLWYERVLRARTQLLPLCSAAAGPSADATESTNVSKVKFVLLLHLTSPSG